jgi:hypothetical protein
VGKNAKNFEETRKQLKQLKIARRAWKSKVTHACTNCAMIDCKREHKNEKGGDSQMRVSGLTTSASMKKWTPFQTCALSPSCRQKEIIVVCCTSCASLASFGLADHCHQCVCVCAILSLISDVLVGLLPVCVAVVDAG